MKTDLTNCLASLIAMKDIQNTANVNGRHSFELETKEGKYFLNGTEVHFDRSVSPSGEQHVIFNNQSRKVEVIELNRENNTCIISVEGKRFEVELTDAYDKLLKSMGIEKFGAKKVKEVKAPMPGLVLEVDVKVGDEVAEGDTLLILEAMKMENALKSPVSGVVASVSAIKGEAVEKGTVLVEFE